MNHQCNLAGCDGTDLGHELARDFPAETARIDQAFDRLANPEDHLMAPAPRHYRKCGRWEADHEPHEWSTPHSRRDGIYYWCEGPTVVEGGRRGPAR